MTSSGLQCSATNSIPLNHGYEKEASEMIQSRRSQFFTTYQPQNFSLPDSIIFYIAKNPTSSELYEKMIQSCKYFFVKNRILVIPVLAYLGDDKWGFSHGQYQLSIKHRRNDLSKIASKLWITDQIAVHPIDPSVFSSVIPKLYQCDAKFVSIYNQILSCHDLSLLISSAEKIHFGDVTVKDESDSNVGIEKIVKIAVKAKNIEIWSSKTICNVTSETLKELIKLPHFSKLDYLTLNLIPETFDLETFYVYMKRNKTTKFDFVFDLSISEAYKNRLEEIVDEILETETRDFEPPLIDFPGLDFNKWRKLDRIFSYHC